MTAVVEARTGRVLAWKDSIPLHYEYTAGVAGERFLRGLEAGKILASECSNCGKRYLPPKTYCVNCFLETTKYKTIASAGTVSALTESYVDFEGRRLAKPRTYAFVTFKGVTGGLIHRTSGSHVSIGTKVKPKFKPVRKRSGTLLDIESFVPA